MLALLLHMYDTCRAQDITQKGKGKGKGKGGTGFLQKSLNLSSHLASSLESLVYPLEANAKGGRGRASSNSKMSSPHRSSKGSRDKLAKLAKQAAAAAETAAAEKKKPFRQALFKSVTGKAPRPNTPGRRASQVFLMVIEQTKKMSANSRRDVIRDRWHKALQQTLMLIRMAKQNARLDAIAAENAARAEEAATAAQKDALAKLWEPIWVSDDTTPPAFS